MRNKFIGLFAALTLSFSANAQTNLSQSPALQAILKTPQSIVSSGTTFPAGLYGLPTDSLSSKTAAKLHVDLTGTRSGPVVGQMIELNDGQTGPASSAGGNTANSASYGYGCTIQRPNWNTSTITGEADCHSIFIRQARGDAAGLLSNIGTQSGFGAFAETYTFSANPDGSVKKSVNTQIGVVNSRDGGEYGFIAQATIGSDDTAILATQSSTGTWSWGYRLTKTDGSFLAGIRGADGAFLGGTVAPNVDYGGNVGAVSNRYYFAYVQNLDLSETTAPPTPSAGHQVIFIDSSDHKLKRKDSTGTITIIG